MTLVHATNRIKLIIRSLGFMFKLLAMKSIHQIYDKDSLIFNYSSKCGGIHAYAQFDAHQMKKIPNKLLAICLWPSSTLHATIRIVS